eukprot:4016533-Pyramimonas_sp.AAC.1
MGFWHSPQLIICRGRLNFSDWIVCSKARANKLHKRTGQASATQAHKWPEPGSRPERTMRR